VSKRASSKIQSYGEFKRANFSKSPEHREFKRAIALFIILFPFPLLRGRG